MGIVLGIDIGGSATKFAALREDMSILAVQRAVSAGAASLPAAAETFLRSCALSPAAIDCIVLTGVGASYIEGDVLGVRTVKVSEFSAIGRGGLFLSGQKRAVVASVGTGTAFIRAEEGQPVQHISGSGIGGGAFMGLSELILGKRDFADYERLAAQGSLSRIDLTIGDMTDGAVGTLPPDATSANFAKITPDATDADKALGIVNLTLQAISSMCVLACRICDCSAAVLVGALPAISSAHVVYDLFHRLYGIDFIVPENAVFATAVGAALQGFEK